MPFHDEVRWVRLRSDLGFVYHEGYSLVPEPGGLVDKRVITVMPNDHYRKKYKCQVLDHVPFHRRKLTSAKKDGELCYAASR